MHTGGNSSSGEGVQEKFTEEVTSKCGSKSRAGLFLERKSGWRQRHSGRVPHRGAKSYVVLGGKQDFLFDWTEVL